MPATSTRRSPTLFRRPSWRRARAVGSALRSETVGGMLLLAGAVVALLWANSPWRESYSSFTTARFGPSALRLDLTLAQWAADGLLAVFFFVVGLELKREFVDGDLRSPSRAALPVVAALGGMAVPVAVYLAVNGAASGGTADGWAVPMATDIAFAVAILAVISTHLPAALRSFLLTLAVVDDLVSVVVIAVFFTDRVDVWPLLGSLAVITVFGLLARRGITRWWLLVPLGLLAWGLMHASGIHSTIAGVLLGFAVPALASRGEPESLSERFEHHWRPISAGVAVPVFALMAAGVSFAGGPAATLGDPAGLGVGLGLAVGKPIGIFGATYLLARFTGARLDDALSWRDIFGVSLLSGVGFTVSLLIGELSFAPGSEREEHIKAAVLFGSLFSAVLATVVLRWRNRAHRALGEAADPDPGGGPGAVRGAADSGR